LKVLGFSIRLTSEYTEEKKKQKHSPVRLAAGGSKVSTVRERDTRECFWIRRGMLTDKIKRTPIVLGPKSTGHRDPTSFGPAH
jgi:hypothetical protein